MKTMMNAWRLSVLLLLGGGTILAAQDLGVGLAEISPGGDETESDSEYFKYLRDGWMLGPMLSMRSLSITLKNNKTNAELKYNPNITWSAGGRAAYKGYGLGLVTGLPLDTDEHKGESDYLDLQLMFLLGQHGFDLIVQQYNGFYLDEKSLIDINDDYRLYPNLGSIMISINYFYVFNEGYSLKPAFDQTARQLKDGGSVMIMVSLNAFGFANDGDIIPVEETASYPSIQGLSSMFFTGIGCSVGFAYTFVKEHWFFTPTIFFGTNVENQTFTTDLGTVTQEVLFNPKLNIKLAAGNNQDDFYYGAFILMDSTGANTAEDIEIGASSTNFTLFVGWRL